MEQFEFRALDILRFEMFFVMVPAGAEIVVVIGGDRDSLVFTTGKEQ